MAVRHDYTTNLGTRTAQSAVPVHVHHITDQLHWLSAILFLLVQAHDEGMLDVGGRHNRLEPCQPCQPCQPCPALPGQMGGEMTRPVGYILIPNPYHNPYFWGGLGRPAVLIKSWPDDPGTGALGIPRFRICVGVRGRELLLPGPTIPFNSTIMLYTFRCRILPGTQ